MIGLFELTNPAPRSIAREDDALQIGETVIVVYIDDRFDTALGEMEALGGQRLTDPSIFEGRVTSQREVLLRDPDGVLVNLIERDPARAFETDAVAD